MSKEQGMAGMLSASDLIGSISDLNMARSKLRSSGCIQIIAKMRGSASGFVSLCRCIREKEWQVG